MERDNTSKIFNTVEEAIEDLRQGKIVIIADDEDRENEGDAICAAEKITPEIANFMATKCRGLICMPITKEKAEQLNLSGNFGMVIQLKVDLESTQVKHC